MITYQPEIEIEKIGTGNLIEGEFTIKANAKSFNILISNIYSDKVTAIIRELSANALDSHIEAGKRDVPIECHVPNSFESFLKVRDYGISMSHEFMMNNYTQAFYSTKNKSNEVAGSIGAGRLVSLVFADNFVCTCFLDNKKRSYQVFKGSNGIPQIMFLGESESQEPQGFEVKISIPVQFHSQFQQKAAEIYQYFNPRPKITGARINIVDKPVILEGADWKVFKSDYYSSKTVTAIMGCYSYPVDKSVVRHSSDLTDAGSKLLDTDIQIIFKIGDLDVNAGREGLSYDERTTKNIALKLNSIAQEVEKHILDKFEKCSTVYEVHCLYNEIKSTNFKYLMESFCSGGQITWHNKTIHVWHLDVAPGITVSEIYFKGKTKLKAHVNSYLDFGPSIKYVVKDIEPQKMTNRLRSTINSGSPVRLIEYTDKAKFDAWAKDSGFDSYPYILISSLQDEKLSYNRTETIKCYKYDGARNYYNAMQPCELDILNDSGYYIVLQSYKKHHYGMISDGESISDYQFSELKDKLKCLGISLPNDIFGIYTKPAVKKLAKNPNMESLFSYLHTELENFVKNSPEIQKIVNYKKWSDLSNNESKFINHLKDFVGLDSQIDDLVAEANKTTVINNLDNLISILGDLQRITGKTVTLPEPNVDFAAEIVKLRLKYPLFDFYSHALCQYVDTTENVIKELQKYIKDNA